jgi:Asp-tRNA(Asn)/Glu-tRNA(Gln) amidotransferase A subunit family amidase
MRFALNIDLGCYVINPEVEVAVREAARALTSAGATVDEVAIPWTRGASVDSPFGGSPQFSAVP